MPDSSHSGRLDSFPATSQSYGPFGLPMSSHSKSSDGPVCTCCRQQSTKYDGRHFKRVSKVIYSEFRDGQTFLSLITLRFPHLLALIAFDTGPAPPCSPLLCTPNTQPAVSQ